jgi:hypothetical protein
MFEVFRSPSRSAAGAIGYVTVGTLMVIWAGLWYYYFLRPLPNPPAWQSYLCMATILSGVAIGVIGLLFGMIGRGAKAADNTVGGVDTNAVSTPVLATPVVQAPVGTRVGAARIVDAPPMAPANGTMRDATR